jgi:hypothetical protein
MSSPPDGETGSGRATVVLDAAAAARIRERFISDGTLRVIPAKRKMKLVVFAWLAEMFEPGRRYAEAEVNAMLKTAHEDVATLRRGLFDEYFVDRSDGFYWRTPGAERVRIVPGEGAA